MFAILADSILVLHTSGLGVMRVFRYAFSWSYADLVELENTEKSLTLVAHVTGLKEG
jgi:hypothetical protein